MATERACPNNSTAIDRHKLLRQREHCATLCLCGKYCMEKPTKETGRKQRHCLPNIICNVSSADEPTRRFWTMNTHFTRLKIFLIIPLLLVTSTLILARWKGTNPTSIQQGQRPGNHLQAEIVTITPTGFEPSEITRPQGRFILAVDNRSGLNEVHLYFERPLASKRTRGPKTQFRVLFRQPLSTILRHMVLK